MSINSKILFSNIGYARGIDGSLVQHVFRFGRNFYCPVPVQHSVLAQVRAIIDMEQPDICCFVEIDSGSIHSAKLNQLEILADTHYPFHDIAGKYGEGTTLSRLWLHQGKSNAFISRTIIPFERIYFSNGGKRLLYRLCLPNGIALYFAHFSLNQTVRTRQISELETCIRTRADSNVIIMADFNIMGGLRELEPLCRRMNLHVLNKESESTFTFHRTRRALDLCLCSPALCDRATLKIIPQPYSDHAALLLDIQGA